MYRGGIILFLGAPLLMGSLYGIIIGLFISFLFIVRIISQEKMWIQKLDGYLDYKCKLNID